MLDKKHIKYFKKILPVDFVLSEEGDCWAYGYDNSKMHVMPECVLFANSKTVKYLFAINKDKFIFDYLLEYLVLKEFFQYLKLYILTYLK